MGWDAYPLARYAGSRFGAALFCVHLARWIARWIARGVAVDAAAVALMPISWLLRRVGH